MRRRSTPNAIAPIFCIPVNTVVGNVVVPFRPGDQRSSTEMVAAAVDVEDSVRTPVAPSPERLRGFYFAATERLTLGLVRYVDSSLRLGPLTPVTFGGA